MSNISYIDNNSVRISSDILEVFRKYVFNYDEEICANLSERTDKAVTIRNLFPTNVLKGGVYEYSPGKFRGTCSHKEYSRNIFHSHPRRSYSYPSREDIIKVLKHWGKIVNSVIATKWGVWIISNTNRSNIFNPTRINELKNYIDHYLNKIGIETRNANRDIGQDKSNDLTEQNIKLISETCEKLSSKLGLQIILYRWENLKGSNIDMISNIND